MPARLIFLARHGQTRMNRVKWINGQMKHDGLDALGFKQRVGLFLLLKDQAVAAVFTSALERTQQTAAPVAAHFNLKPVVVPELNEFRGGVFQGICSAFLRGRAKSAAAASCDKTSGDPLVKRAEGFLRGEAMRSVGQGIGYRAPGGGESVLDVDRRIKRFLARIPTGLADKTVVIVGHGGTNRFLLANLMGWPLSSARRVRQQHTQVFRIERTGNSNKPKLSVFFHGRWVECPGPPDPRRGLACMRKKPEKTGPRQKTTSPE